MQQYLQIGQISTTHGVRGEVRAQSWGDGPDSLVAFDHFYVGKELASYRVLRARAHKNVVILQLDGVGTIEQAQALVGQVLWMKRDELPKLPAGSYYQADLIGLVALLADGSTLGKVTGLFPTGSTQVLEIQTPEHRELLVPFINDCVPAVDLAAGTLLVIPLPGLFDEEGQP